MQGEFLTPHYPDMGDEEFRGAAAQVVDWVARYLNEPHPWPVLPNVAPGEIARSVPSDMPLHGVPMHEILDDFERLVPSATTHWNDPRFFAYFSVTGSAPGILGEMLAATLNVNAMLWRSGPAATELEQVTLEWVRQLIGLPPGLMGEITDTASTSTLYALAAAREHAELGIRENGLSGRDLPQLRVYCSEEAHSSVDKAALTLGLGMNGIRHIATDEKYAMDPDALRQAIAEDRAAGIRPIAVVATVGTTSTTAVDPVPRIADICEAENLWLHVDAAYGGSAGAVPGMRWIMDGVERAHSVVVNPHKWLFVPIDCSALYTSRPDLLRRAFSLVPEYLTTTAGDDVLNLMDYGVALGRRFRAIKLWFVLRYFGADGIAARIREHLRLARSLATWIDDEPRFERLAPTQFSVVVFRSRPDGASEAEIDAHNQRLLERANASGEMFISHTRAKGRFALRIAIGNMRTTEQHVRRAWDIIRELARS